MSESVASCCSTQTVVAKVEPKGSCCSSSAPKPTPPKSSGAGLGWRAYRPLIVIVSLSLLVGLALEAGSGSPTLMGAMSGFMGFFLVVFAMLKLFDLPGFVNGFAKYDIAAGAFRPYGYVYPFLELGFGLALLAKVWPVAVNAGLAALMFFGAVGVLRSLSRGENLRCACLGATLNVPLSTVAVVEDIGMGVMSLAMLGMLAA